MWCKDTKRRSVQGLGDGERTLPDARWNQSGQAHYSRQVFGKTQSEFEREDAGISRRSSTGESHARAGNPKGFPSGVLR